MQDRVLEFSFMWDISNLLPSCHPGANPAGAVPWGNDTAFGPTLPPLLQPAYNAKKMLPPVRQMGRHRPMLTNRNAVLTFGTRL